MRKFILLTFLITAFAGIAFAQNVDRKKLSMVTVKVSDHGANSADTLLLMYYTDPLYNVPSQNGDYKEIKSAMDKDGCFHFKFPFDNKCGRFFIGRKARPSDSVYKIPSSLSFLPLTNLYLPERGDKILIDVHEYYNPNYGFACHLDFTGPGSTKYTVQDSIKNFNSNIKLSPVFNENYEYVKNNSNVTRLKELLGYLENCKPKLSDNAYNVIKADIYSRNALVFDGDVEYYESRLVKVDSVNAVLLKRKFVRQYNKYLRGISNYGLIPSSLLKSTLYIRFIINKIESCDFVVNGINKSALYEYLKANFHGELRDQLLATYFLYKPPGGIMDMTKMQDALATVRSFYCRKRLLTIEKRMSSKMPGDFSLPDKSGKMISMDDFKGRAVLIDFWFTGCGACTHFYTETLSKVEEIYKNNQNIVFISISIDGNKLAWCKSLADNRYSSATAINLYTMGQGARHGIVSYYNVSAYPTLLLFDRKHKLLNYNKPDLRREQTLITQIEHALLQ